MPPEYRVVSLGTLSTHPLWEVDTPARTPHATTSLVMTDDACVLINPSLPQQMLDARLMERTPHNCRDITHVFMTSLDVDHRRGLDAFPQAQCLAHEPELAHTRARLMQEYEDAVTHTDDETVAICQARLDAIAGVQAAPDRIIEGVDLFPLPGVTLGTCGLLLSQPRATVLIAGDAIATAEHMEQGKVLPGCHDLEKAHESFKEAIEIADVIIPGRDNILVR
ncbi:MAG: MBL fold metallo-hydrolase [Phycisphaerales bacterium]|nr:MBL fold metallo-hydrolase [Phycisphaerales bacterium]|tara:strand:- start:705 stop:1373 length:669 start_codon:yes stop_codon:yes gene_type:complete